MLIRALLLLLLSIAPIFFCPAIAPGLSDLCPFWPSCAPAEPQRPNHFPDVPVQSSTNSEKASQRPHSPSLMPTKPALKRTNSVIRLAPYGTIMNLDEYVEETLSDRFDAYHILQMVRHRFVHYHDVYLVNMCRESVPTNCTDEAKITRVYESFARRFRRKHPKYAKLSASAQRLLGEIWHATGASQLALTALRLLSGRRFHRGDSQYDAIQRQLSDVVEAKRRLIGAFTRDYAGGVNMPNPYDAINDAVSVKHADLIHCMEPIRFEL